MQHAEITTNVDDDNVKGHAGGNEQANDKDRTENGLTTAGTSRVGGNTKENKTEDIKPGPTKNDNGTTYADGNKKAKTKTQAPKDKQKTDDKGSNKRRKAFITLSYIVVAYMICWVPFHFVFDVSLANPDIVPEDLYTAAFWMTYVNSGLNPFMYAFSSADFRGAVVQLIKCRYCRSQL